ncbi:glycosyltransferase family 4 protein [Alkaliphilus crotonatoxidans]
MKILFCIRDDYLSNMAGDTIQFLKTREYLSKLGLSVDVSHNPYENLEAYDLIHLFNTIRIADTYRFYRNGIKYKKKIVLTPIYWNYFRHMPSKEKGEVEQVYWNEGNRQRKEVFLGVNYILPSAEAEMRQIEIDFNVQKDYSVIPNGVDQQFIKGDGKAFLGRYSIDYFVLCVGRVCKHKNQLSLAKITHRLKVPFVMVGPVNHLGYYYECMKANPDIIYLPSIAHENLAEIYHGARVHCLVSWYEIPGLVNLEAGLAGCHVLTTWEGSTREYFQDLVSYADPHNIDEIEAKLVPLLKNENKNIPLQNHIQRNYLWEDVAKGILKVYERLIKA